VSEARGESGHDRAGGDDQVEKGEGEKLVHHGTPTGEVSAVAVTLKLV